MSLFADVDILRLVIFYNEDFSINPGDLLPDKKAKVHFWFLDQ